MASRYLPGTYIYPPLAGKAQDPSLLAARDSEGIYEAEIKKNGTHSLVFIDPDRNVIGWNRHGEKHRAWQFNQQTAQIFKAIPGREWFVIEGELLHNKTPHIKNQHYLYDILVCDGIHLTGTTYAQRYQLLFDVLARGMDFAATPATADLYRLDAYTSIARTFTSGFAALFGSLSAPEDEGLVLRKPAGVYTGPKAASWISKFRRREITKLY